MQEVMSRLRFKLGRAFYLIMLVIFSVLVVPLQACSHIDEETPRSFVRFVAADTTDLRAEISRTLEQGAGNVRVKSRPLVLTAKQGLDTASIDFGWITEQGAIVAYSKKLSVVILFEPSVASGKVTWNCIVYPDEAKPKECGSWK